jgi:hypothetical protein
MWPIDQCLIWLKRRVIGRNRQQLVVAVLFPPF